MRRKTASLGWVLLGALAWVGLAALANAADEGADAKAAFARLKGLGRGWKAEIVDEKGEAQATTKVSYRVTSNGSTIMETLFEGDPHEMITMYHLDGSKLKLTHYCAAGNQPHLQLDAKASTPDRLVFEFVGGTNLDPAKDTHMHSGVIEFKGDAVMASWDGYQAGKKAGTHTFRLTRR